MNLNTFELSADVDKLRAVIASLTGKNPYLEDYVRLLKKELFKRKTELENIEVNGLMKIKFPCK